MKKHTRDATNMRQTGYGFAYFHSMEDAFKVLGMIKGKVHYGITFDSNYCYNPEYLTKKMGPGYSSTTQQYGIPQASSNGFVNAAGASMINVNTSSLHQSQPYPNYAPNFGMFNGVNSVQNRPAMEPQIPTQVYAQQQHLHQEHFVRQSIPPVNIDHTPLNSFPRGTVTSNRAFPQAYPVPPNSLTVNGLDEKTLKQQLAQLPNYPSSSIVAFNNCNESSSQSSRSREEEVFNQPSTNLQYRPEVNDVQFWR
jgi:hypothetical protein